MSGRLHYFLSDESGTTAIEYALIAAGISMAIRRGAQQYRKLRHQYVDDDQKRAVS